MKVGLLVRIEAKPEYADEVEAMETPLFARFGFAPIAHQEYLRTETGGLHVGWTLLVGPLLAPAKLVTIRLRIVCFSMEMTSS